MFLRLRSPSLNSCSIWKHILPPPPYPNPHHRFPSKETKIHLSHHQHQLSPRNPFPHVPVDMSDCYGEKKRSGEDEVDSCICSMHSSCWSSFRGCKRDKERNSARRNPVLTLQDAELSPGPSFSWDRCRRVGRRKPSLLKGYQAKETVQSFCLALE